MALQMCNHALTYIDDDCEVFAFKGEIYFYLEEWYNAREEYKKSMDSVKVYIETGPREKIQWFQTIQTQVTKSHKLAQDHVEGNFRRDYYQILDISPGSTRDQINRGYKRQALLWHPDKHQHKDENQKRRAERMMRTVNEAKEILSEAPKKCLYEHGWNFKEINLLEREGELPIWMEKEKKARTEQAYKMMEAMGERMHPMMGGPRVNFHGTKYGELFDTGKPFGEGGQFEGFPGRVTKLAGYRHHPDDDKDIYVIIQPPEVELSLGDNIRIPYAQRIAEEEEHRRRQAEQYDRHKYDRQDYGDESDDF